MISKYLLSLTSISQWGLFLGIVFIIYGWLEKKEKFILAGQITFLLVGFFAAWILLTNQVEVTETAGGAISKQAKLLAFFKGFVWFSILNIITLLIKFFKPRFVKASMVILVVFALMLFFMIYSVQQMAG